MVLWLFVCSWRGFPMVGFPYVPLSVLELTGTPAGLNLTEISHPLPPEIEHVGIKGVHYYTWFTSLLKLLSPFERCFRFAGTYACLF